MLNNLNRLFQEGALPCSITPISFEKKLAFPIEFYSIWHSRQKTTCTVIGRYILKGHNMQHSGHMDKKDIQN